MTRIANRLGVLMLVLALVVAHGCSSAGELRERVEKALDRDSVAEILSRLEKLNRKR